jgi:hypothetical protein
VDSGAVKRLRARLGGVLLLGGLCIGCGKSDGGVSMAPSCAGAFVMPNPASTGLPNPASYTTNTDGTVADNVSGLVWQGAVDPGDYTQARAGTSCANLGGAWRLPTRLELVSLVDFTVAYPGLTINSKYFPNTPAASFWTSSATAGASEYAWIVGFDSGVASVDSVASTHDVRCVQAASKCDPARYQVRAGGLVLDHATGLTWRQAVAPDSYAWSDATTYCAGLGAGWRLPSLTELQTIVEDTTLNPAIDRTAFPGTPSTYFWTSSGDGAGGAWYVDFDSGTTGLNDATIPYGVRCVR